MYFIVWIALSSCVCGYTQAKHRNVAETTAFNLLKDIPHSKKFKLEGSTRVKAWNFQDGSEREIIYVDLHKVFHKHSRELSLEFVGFSQIKTNTTLFGVYLKHKKLPLFEISLDIHRRKFIVRYQGNKSFQRVTLTFSKTVDNWRVLSISVNKTHVTVNVGCEEARSVKLKQKLSKIPKRAFGTLGSGKNGEDKFVGTLLQAQISSYQVGHDQLLCYNQYIREREDGYVNDAAVNGDRILLLEQQITLLNKLVDKLKSQNTDLTGRVTDLESCCESDCEWEGRLMENGETWSPDTCTVCICTEGKSDCLRRTDIPSCQTPCQSNPCLNYGQCVSFDESASVPLDNFQCVCQPPYDGQFCEFKENPCVWPQSPGICDQNLPRFYYDADLQECLPFNYTGCGGNINNYETIDECRSVAVVGACCFRKYSLRVEDVIVSSQNEIFDCKEITLSECQSTHRQEVGDQKVEVISFFPGVKCDEANCGRSNAQCTIDDRIYKVGEKAVLGCQECTCERSGQFVCSCSQKAVRKEIRDMTAQELAQFQAAVQQLRLVGPGNPWEEFRDIYMRHTMHSNGGPYFLPWHRLFLRKLEQRLQQIDCSITLPYYDFTTDIGNFEDAVIWQPNYFGGNGFEGCVPDHPFGPSGSWRPCINRKFNPDVKLPTLVELALAIASEDYLEMSMCLESYVSYVHTYIGGDMATRAASYDPIFFSVHAYIDMLYWWWQNKSNNKFKYPAAFHNIPMVPFNVPPSAILDLESDLCVTYLWPSRGSPCNRTLEGKDNGRTPPRGDVTPDGGDTFTGGFNVFGYSADGYDRRGFDKTGFRKNGFNRDGYNKDGYDVDGYSRYGYDADGYSPYGYDIEGWDKANMQDLTGRYNSYGLDMNCLTIRGYTTEGYDKHGFNWQGYNKESCNYLYKGPFATIQSRQIWEILLIQPKPFLMTIARTCPALEPLAITWLQQYWINSIKDVTEMVEVEPSRSMMKNSARFCFDIDDFVTPCGCDAKMAVCPENPCAIEMCPSYPEAVCRVDFCGVCQARWYVNGKLVDCFEERDFCQPNPCENGGTCIQSIWPSEPQLTTCQCPPGYDGHFCQFRALDVCELPLSNGDCAEQETRWFFNHQTQACKAFVYTGCGGNANNFLTKGACEARCKLGACCYRYPKDSDAMIGYDLQGYDMYGFDASNKNRRGDVRIESNGIKTGRDRFGSTRYDWQGYDRNGFDRDGYDRWGLDKSGYDWEGFNLTGYSRQGEYDGNIDYDKNGFDPEGYNRLGISCSGTSREGLNAFDVYTEYTYKCRYVTLQQCQNLEDDVTRVVKFTRGQRCEQVNCEESCGCPYGDKTYRFGETFRTGCQFCTCTYTGAVECSCPEIYRRKEIRDMTVEEMQKYQDAIKSLNKMDYPSAWYNYSQMYSEYKAQAVGNSASLPWHRNFLRMIERRLQEIDCSITIPYYDWTLNAGDQIVARVWSASIFAGTGKGVDDCVTHHPFKDYYPPYWVPCLRRRFNKALPLPDVVDLQVALNEPDYDTFRLHMEVYFNMFKSWVGGHMDSDASPYDPLFLSVAAFIDRVWWDWQNKHDNGLLRYPQELRYIPMMPFRTLPDDVMDSKKQMCVTYYPLSEIGACNITLPNLGYNSMGYDRHGYDREGYDIEGYNVFGIDREGNEDDRGIYNILGYDRQGYRRNGYDSMGFDRFQFTEDDYNVDGFDSKGFDRSGYNRYGFDKTGRTPFGFHRNGTLLVNVVHDLFDSYGYNNYGLDRYGLDRQGYDVFGFDTMGYDRRRCNNYFIGPMLVLVKHWAEVELDRVDDKTIRVITRICPPVTNFPEWRYTNNWLKRDSQVPLIEGIVGRAQERAVSAAQQPRTSSVTDDNLWLPVGPDRSLCFTTYYYTQCAFGEVPVECVEDLCRNRKCPGYPSAVCRVMNCGVCDYEWYNGLTGNPIECSGCIDRTGVERGEGLSWATSDCETCSCEAGLATCVEETCLPVFCTHPIKMPGKCCLQCSGCEYDTLRLADGQEFSPAVDSCDRCVCRDGSVTCRYVDCPELGPCSSQMVLEGECCPTCLDCGNHDNGDSWRETPCQQCTCVDGRVECEKIRCIPPDCSHPLVPPGECCATCEGCLADGRALLSGQTYMLDQCTECVCNYGNVVCDPLPCDIPVCSSPITPQGECCPRCDNECMYGGRTYRHGQSFPSPRDRCLNCTCDNSAVTCAPVTCQRMDLPCKRPITLPGDCCPSECPTCFAEGRDYLNGERWTSYLDPCENCVCDEGQAICTRIDRCPRECDHGVTRTGECCSDCTECLFLGLNVRDGQQFVRPGDNCQQCTCNRGQVTCVSLGPCPELPCRVTETAPGACCPQCLTCNFQGGIYSHGELVTSTACSTCYCLEGEITCERVDCPEVKCRNPVRVPGECCPVCLECDYRGRTYEDGKRFTPRAEPCLDCVCTGGEVDCTSRESECPRSQCTHPIRSLRQCCPTCNGCTYLRRRFRNGQKFVPPGNDNCKVCRCSAGSVTCSNMGCPAVNCDNAVLVKGQCCPVCPMGCNVMGIEYRDGQTFIDFMDRCKVCTCMMGQIRCMAMMSCPPVTCTHPAMRQGNCCPSCTMCEMNSVQYRNGETFVNPVSICQECTCRDGTITCRRKSQLCPRANCIDPVLDPDTCCPVCQGMSCSYAGRQYRDGQVVPASRDVCEECACSGGMVDCSRKECPPVACRHPGRDQCCDTCEFCDFNDMRFELGEMFPSPYRACEDCVCQAGSVECQRKQCSVPNCGSPTYPPGACCPVCSDCTFQGMLYSDGEDFMNPSKPCERCHCMKGNVACDRRLCPQANCRDSVLVDCCPVCEGCWYNHETYENGETFTSHDGCQTCLCEHGNVQCTAQTCLQPLVTLDCTYQNFTVRNGETVLHENDACIQCTCTNGTTSCDPLPCQPVQCTHPVQGHCCIECNNCDFLGQIVRNGEIFIEAPGSCNECQCYHGNVQCTKRTCPEVDCSHPAVDRCCAVCDSCIYARATYENGETFNDPTDPCQDCTCDSGNIVCQNICSERCESNGRFYDDGEYFPGEEDPCVECSCYKGDIECSRRQCLAVSCSHPTISQCCPECTGCHYGNKVYQNGEQFRTNCTDCVCRDGNVDCRSTVDCPEVPCGNPIFVDCCPRCGGCEYRGSYLAEGTQFPVDNDPCSTCICQEGKVECSFVECGPIRCTHPTRGRCCPECVHCEIGGEIVTNGDDYKHTQDNCTICSCDYGSINCVKKPCDPVSCDTHDLDICGCPRCSGDCFHGNMRIRDGDIFDDTAGPCRNCVCKDGEVTCETRQCVPCSAGERKVTRPDQCCPRCVPRITQTCVYGGSEKQTGEIWWDDECTKCSCIDGTVNCSGISCPALDCSDDSVPVITPGICCPVCSPKPGTCSVYGDPHYRTFDGRTLHLQGTCRYVMATDCDNTNFSVEIQHDDRGVAGVSWAQNFTIQIGSFFIDFLQDHRVLVGGRDVMLPYAGGNDIAIEKLEGNVFLNTWIGLKFIWDGASYAELSVPGSYKRKMCGLCGNFNGFPGDDLHLRSGGTTLSPAVFANSWKTIDQLSDTCAEATDDDPCVSAEFTARSRATTMCEVIRGESFSDCHRVVDYGPYFASCVYDLCACRNPSTCLCDVLSSYARECAKLGVPLQWRSHSLCAMECDTSRGLIFDDCGPVCRRTCDNWQTPLGDVAEHCYKPCVAGCQCPANQVLHNDRCIDTAQCPNT